MGCQKGGLEARRPSCHDSIVTPGPDLAALQSVVQLAVNMDDAAPGTPAPPLDPAQVVVGSEAPPGPGCLGLNHSLAPLGQDPDRARTGRSLSHAGQSRASVYSINLAPTHRHLPAAWHLHLPTSAHLLA